MMGKLLAVVLALVVLIGTIAYDITASKDHIYNGGYHKHCGGQWIHCERDATYTWHYCNKCGVQEKF